MIFSKNKISRIETKIKSGQVLSWSDVLYYEKYVLDQNNFTATHIFSSEFTAVKLYVDANKGLFYSTPSNSTEYSFHIYKISDVAEVYQRADDSLPIDHFCAKGVGTALGGIVGSVIAGEIAKSRNLLSFVGLGFKFKDGSRKYVNFVSSATAIKFESWKYNQVMKTVNAACALIQDLIKTTPIPSAPQGQRPKQNAGILSPQQIENIVNDLLTMDRDAALLRIDNMQLPEADCKQILEKYSGIVPPAPLSPVLSKQGIDAIVSKLLSAPSADVRNILSSMDISEVDKRVIWDSYQRAIAASGNHASSVSARVSYHVDSSPSGKNISNPKKKHTIVWIVVGIAIAIVIVAIVIAASSPFFIQSSAADSAPSVNSTEPIFDHPEAEIPKNYSVIRHTSAYTPAPLEITTPSDGSYYYIMLRNSKTDEPIMDFFMYPGCTYEFSVPLGDFSIYIASGEYWYGQDYLFGPYGVYSKLDSVFSFTSENDGYESYYAGYELELSTTNNGNLDSFDLDYDSFINGSGQ